MSKPLFSLGQVVATPGALAALQEANQEPVEFLQRHIAGDWGDMVDEDKEANDRALEDGTRVFSAYPRRINTHSCVVAAVCAVECVDEFTKALLSRDVYADHRFVEDQQFGLDRNGSGDHGSLELTS